MSLVPLTPGYRLTALAVLGLSALPLTAQAQLRPAVLPEEICLVLQNGPFDAEVAALIAGRDDFASILVQAEATCPELLGNLIGATATIPETERESEGGGPRDLPIIPLTPPTDVVTIPVEEEPDPETPPGDGDGGTLIDPLPRSNTIISESAAALL